MLTYGYFNSVDGDRIYNADQMSSMFEGLITDGVFNGVGSSFQVTNGEGLSVNVGTGRAWLEDRWVKNDSIANVPITAASAALSRYTAVVLRKNTTTRNIILTTIDGTPALTPSYPNIVRDGDVYDICLAYVLVGPSASSILQTNIIDARSDSSVCGWVTGLIEQVDISTLFAQWEAAYDASIEEIENFTESFESGVEEWQSGFETDMEDWEAQAKANFDAWLDTLTEELNITTYVEDYWNVQSFTSGTSHTVTLNMVGYTYAAEDVITVWINGLIATAGTDYTIDTSGAQPVLTFTQYVGASNDNPYKVVVQVIKSRIGFSS